MSVNGVPLFDSAAGWVKTQEARQVVQHLREVSRWAQSVFGVALEARTLDVLLELGQGSRLPQPPSVRCLAHATGLSMQAVRAVLQRLAQGGLLQMPDIGEEQRPVHLHPRFLLAWQQFEDLLESTFVSRRSLREAYLINTVADPALARAVQRLFDRIFDLGWLYLHNWAGTCHVAATLVAKALQLEGLPARPVVGCMHVHREGRGFRVGGSGQAVPGLFDAHVYALVEERVLVDFGLGNVRQTFARGFPWGLALDLHAAEPGVVAVLEHERTGRVVWRNDWSSAEAAGQMAVAEQIAQQLMPMYRAQG